MSASDNNKKHMIDFFKDLFHKPNDLTLFMFFFPSLKYLTDFLFACIKYCVEKNDMFV